MTFKTQLATDLAQMMNTSEFADSIVLTTVESVQISGAAVIDVVGESDGDWSGGNAMVATAILDKATFTTKPKSGETITAGSTTWYVDSLINECPVSWTVKMFSEHKPR